MSATPQAELLEAALQVFARYGYRKASMDQVARAAGLSRQGLYLHFPSKDALFRAVVGSLLAETLGAGAALLAEDARPLEERLVTAFDAVYGRFLDGPGSLHHSPYLQELWDAATQLLGAQIQAQEQAFRDAVAQALARGGVAATWAAGGFTAAELAGLLDAVACGLKHRACPRPDFLVQVSKAAQLLCRGCPQGGGPR